MKKLNLNTKEILYLHKCGLYDREIADLLGCERSNITYHLNKMGYNGRKSKINDINLRNRISNSLVGRYTYKNNPNCKDYSNERIIARGICKTLVRRKMRENGYKCMHCGSEKMIQGHHKKPFHIIFDEFIKNVYSGNKETFYYELMNYKDFIDMDNIYILCKKCHYQVHYTDNHELSPYRWESATTIEKSSTSQAIGDGSARNLIISDYDIV